MPSVVSVAISIDPTKKDHKGSIQSIPPTSPHAHKKSSWTDHVEAMFDVTQGEGCPPSMKIKENFNNSTTVRTTFSKLGLTVPFLQVLMYCSA